MTIRVWRQAGAAGTSRRRTWWRRATRVALWLGFAHATASARVAAQSASAGEGVSVTFLANEGVLLASGGKKVLIDALFLPYGPGYATPADSTHDALIHARPPFDGVDLVLVTHRHGDHFDPRPVAAHLQANPRATLLTSQQVIDSLRRYAPARQIAEGRMVPRTTRPRTRRRVVVGGIAVELLGLPHGGFRHRGVEHLGYIVELGGRRILHVGDTDINASVFRQFRLDTARVDVALLPMWMVTSRDGRDVIARWIRPRQVVAIHVDAGGTERASREVRAAMPSAITFGRPLETRRW